MRVPGRFAEGVRMRRKLLLGLAAVLAAVAAFAIAAVPASAQGGSPTEDQYEPPEPPGGGEDPGGDEGAQPGAGEPFIGVPAVPGPGAAAGAQEALPFTGLDLRLLLLIAAALLAAGLLLRAAVQARGRQLARRGVARA